MQTPSPDLDFWNSDSKIYFWTNLDRKSQSCPFFLKIGTNRILTMLILIPTLVFWISYPKSIFGQIWAKKVKIVCFAWKVVHMVSRACWFLFQHSKLKSIFGQIWTKKLQVVQFGWKLGHRVSRWCWFLFQQSISMMLILIPTLLFSISNPKFFFGQIWAKKFKVVYFDWKLAHMVYWGCWFLFRQ